MLVTACNKPAQPDTNFCQAGCKSLAAANCFLGTEKNCIGVLRQAASSHQSINKATGKPITCQEIAAIKTTADARRIGFSCGQAL